MLGLIPNGSTGAEGFGASRRVCSVGMKNLKSSGLSDVVFRGLSELFLCIGICMLGGRLVKGTGLELCMAAPFTHHIV